MKGQQRWPKKDPRSRDRPDRCQIEAIAQKLREAGTGGWLAVMEGAYYSQRHDVILPMVPSYEYVAAWRILNHTWRGLKAMTNDILDTRISLNLTPTEAHEFVVKLASDDAFRTRLEQNPAEVLAEHHIYIPIDQLPGFVVVPSKESLQQALHKFTTRGEIDVGALFSPSGWPLMCFWWLYMTPAKPPHAREGEKVHVRSK